MTPSPAPPERAANTAALVEQTLTELRARFDVAQTDITLGDRRVTIYHPRNADDLIDEDAFAEDERLPYWADVWPSARVLAERVVRIPAERRRLLELGCGAGLVSVAAVLAGFEVTASDYYEDALRFTALNVVVNTGVLIETRSADWRRFPHDMGRFDVVAASDVLYERAHAQLVAAVLDRTMTGRGLGLIADPGRLAAPEFVDQCQERGMIAVLADRVPFEDGDIRQTIDLYEIRRR